MIRFVKPMVGQEEINGVSEVIRSGMLAQGPKVKQFEKEFSEYIGTKHATAVSSGTSALMLIMKAFDLKQGDEVITTPFSFVATANSIFYCGAKPVFADIDTRTFNIDPEKIEDLITPKTKAILPVHLFGQSANMKRINEIAEKHNLLVFEDACQSHGSELNGKKVGSLGDASAFSFYPTKNVAAGEGGMVLTNNEEIAEKIKVLRNHGQTKSYSCEFLSFNFRMTDIGAAIGLSQLHKLDNHLQRRREIAKKLNQELSEYIEIPYVIEGANPVYHPYSTKSDKRDLLRSKLIEKEVETRIFYPIPIPMQPLYLKLGYGEKVCPVASEVSKKILSLPSGPHLSDEEVEIIIQKTKESIGELK